MRIQPKYSVIIPVFNSENCIDELMERLVQTMEKYAPYELIFVDDFSSDNSWEKLIKAKGNRENIRLIRLTNNFGQAQALICGLHLSKADILINIDDDLQFQPEDIDVLIEHFQPEKYYVLFGVPRKKNFSITNLFFSKIAQYIFRSSLKKGNQRIEVSSFRIFKKYYRQEEYSERTMLSVQVFFTMVSPKLMDSIFIDKHLKRKGNSSYSFFKRLKILLEFLLTSSPLTAHFLKVCYLISGLVFVSSIPIAIFCEDILYKWGLVLIFLSFWLMFMTIGIAIFYLRKIYLGRMGANTYAIWDEK